MYTPRPLTLRRRIWVFTFALLQFVMQGAMVVGDGHEAATSVDSARPHIEANGAHCPKVHTDDCQVCQFVAHGLGVVAFTDVVPTVVPVQTQAVAVAPVSPSRSTPHRALLPRAPPIPLA